MGWKNWSYWLGGGIILLILYIILAITVNLMCSNSSGSLFTGGGPSSCLGWAILFIFISFSGLLFSELLGFNSGFLILLITSITYFIIGAVIGQIISLIMKKIKSKKQIPGVVKK